MLNEIITWLISRDICLDLDFPLNGQKRDRPTQGWHGYLRQLLICPGSWLSHKSLSAG